MHVRNHIELYHERMRQNALRKYTQDAMSKGSLQKSSAVTLNYLSNPAQRLYADTINPLKCRLQ